jgi:hypothetical protein
LRRQLRWKNDPHGLQVNLARGQLDHGAGVTMRDMARRVRLSPRFHGRATCRDTQNPDTADDEHRAHPASSRKHPSGFAFVISPDSWRSVQLESDLTSRSIFHGKKRFTDERLGSMAEAGLVHFGGHGNPDRIDDGLTAGQVPRLQLAPCVVFNGACYTGVTGRWFDQTAGRLAEKRVAPDDFSSRKRRLTSAHCWPSISPKTGLRTAPSELWP